MSFTRVIFAALGAFVAYFAIGFLVFGLSPLADEFRRYPLIYRSQEGMARVMPLGMVAMFVAMLVLAMLYAMMYRGGASGAAQGTVFGALIGLFSVCAFVIHNYVNLNIGLRLTSAQAIAYFLEWTVVGLVIGLIYRPQAT